MSLPVRREFVSFDTPHPRPVISERAVAEHNVVAQTEESTIPDSARPGHDQPGTSVRTHSEPAAIPPTAPLIAVILTYQEEANLPACLASLAEWVRDVVVVDSGSRDRTLEIAREHGARILSHPFETHARQWKWALDTLRSELREGADPWILGLDADQRVTPELRDELLRLEDGLAVPGGPDAVHGFYIRRRQVFRGRWIRHGGYYPIYLLKLFRLSKVRFDEHDLVDHHFYLDGQVGTLKCDLVEDNQKENDISFWIEKHARYAVQLAREEDARRRQQAGSLVQPAIFGTRDQRRLWLKSWWFRLPLFVRPFLYFLYRYVLRLGFLDGKQGLIFHFLHACWFRFLVDVHLDQLRAEARRGASEGGDGVKVRVESESGK